jgi:hypothetical protein
MTREFSRLLPPGLYPGRGMLTQLGAMFKLVHGGSALPLPLPPSLVIHAMPSPSRGELP